MPLRLKYTRNDGPRDFRAIAPEAPQGVGRVFQSLDPKAKPIWVWAANGYIEEAICWLNGMGREATKIAACEALEAYWFAALERLREQSRLPPVPRP